MDPFTKPLTRQNNRAMPIAGPLAGTPVNPVLGNGIAGVPATAAARPIGAGIVPSGTDMLATKNPNTGNGPLAVPTLGNIPDQAQRPVTQSTASRLPQPIASRQPATADITVDELLKQLNQSQIAGRQTGKLPQGVNGIIQVVGDTADPSFKPEATRGAILTDSGYYTGSEFGNSPLATGGGSIRMSEIAGASKKVAEQKGEQLNQTQPPPLPIYQGRPIAGSFGGGTAGLWGAAVMERGDNYNRAMAVKRHFEEQGLDLKKQELIQKNPLLGAQTDYYKAHADLFRAQASPEYLHRQEQTSEAAAMLQERRDIATRLREAQRNHATALKSGDPDQIAGAVDLITALNEDAGAVGVKPLPVPNRPMTSDEEATLKTQATENLKAKRGSAGRFFNTTPSAAEISAEVQRLKATSSAQPLNRFQTARISVLEQKLADGTPLSDKEQSQLQRLWELQQAAQAGSNSSYTAQRDAFIRSQAENPEQYINQPDNQGATNQQPQQPSKAMLSGNAVVVNGQSHPLNPDGTVSIDGRKYRVQ